MLFQRRWLLLCLSMCGCAHTLSLTVDALPAGKQEAQSVGMGQVLRSGDQFSLTVESERAGHLYVLRVPQSGARQVLQGEQRIMPGTPLHLPAGGGWFELDGQIGEENLFILTSAARISEEQLQRIELGKPGLPPGTQGADNVRDAPPPTFSDKNRGQKVSVPIKQKGVTVLRFTFRHR